MGLICTTCGSSDEVRPFGEGKNLCGKCSNDEDTTRMDGIFEEMKRRWPYVEWVRDLGISGTYNGVKAGLINSFGTWMLFTNIYGPAGKGMGADPYELISRVTQWKEGSP